mgnify:CR=1 FL=1
MEVRTLLSGEYDQRDALVNIRAGAGGIDDAGFDADGAGTAIHSERTHAQTLVLGGIALNSFLKAMIDRGRPDVVPHAVEVLTASFPSSHAMMSTITYLTLGLICARNLPGLNVRRYIMTVAMMVPLIIGCTRVVLGVHWPTDVLAGWCLGALWVLFCWAVAARITGGKAVSRA